MLQEVERCEDEFNNEKDSELDLSAEPALTAGNFVGKLQHSPRES